MIFLHHLPPSTLLFLSYIFNFSCLWSHNTFALFKFQLFEETGHFLEIHVANEEKESGMYIRMSLIWTPKNYFVSKHTSLIINKKMHKPKIYVYVCFTKHSDSSQEILMITNSLHFLGADRTVWSCLQLRKAISWLESQDNSCKKINSQECLPCFVIFSFLYFRTVLFSYFIEVKFIF